MMELRGYQREMLERLERAWGKYRSVMVQMPTGTGKTVLLAEIVKRELRNHGITELRNHGITEPGNQGRTESGNPTLVVIVAHRRELIEQIRGTLRAFGIESDRVRVESIQKLTRGEPELRNDGITESGNDGITEERNQGITESVDPWIHKSVDPWIRKSGNPTLVIVDEAHHAVAKTYRRLWEWWPEAKFLGLTATPCRMNGAAFTDLFDTLLSSWDIQTFIDEGWLSDFEYVSVTPDNQMVERIRGLKKRGADGDYQTKEMATVMDTEESVEHLYRSYLQYARGKKGIVYAINREHARHIAAYYQAHGVRSAVIDSKTIAAERAELVARYRGITELRNDGIMESRNHGITELRNDGMTEKRNQGITELRNQGMTEKRNQGITELRNHGMTESGTLDVLVNVDIFSEGFDCPEVEFIQLARPTLSLAKYLQQVGRGMRVTKGKGFVVILDQVGMYQTFGLPTEDRDWRQMFLGKQSGKGLQGGERGYIIRNEPNDVRLLNLEMVRIKRHGEQSTGVEVFMMNGRFGILKDGKVTCPAVFEHVKRLEAPYFAIGYYPYYVYHNRATVIDENGYDLKPRLYGQVRLEGDVFMGLSSQGERVYWEGMLNLYFKQKPEVIAVCDGHLAMLKVDNKYYIPKLKDYFDHPLEKQHIFLGERFTVMENYLVMNGKNSKVYKIAGFGSDGVLLHTPRGHTPYRLLSPKGQFVKDYYGRPYGYTPDPYMLFPKIKPMK